MPIYEYRCGNGHTFEVMQRMTDEPLTSCSTCDAAVERVFHPVAVHFKGSGFYSTDYAGKGKEKAGASKDGTSSEGSGESKGAKDSGGDGKSKANGGEKKAKSESGND